MKTFIANEYTEKTINLIEKNRLGELYEMIIKGDEDFLLKVGNVTHVIISSPLSSKVRNGEFRLTESVE